MHLPGFVNRGQAGDLGRHRSRRVHREEAREAQEAPFS